MYTIRSLKFDLTVHHYFFIETTRRTWSGGILARTPQEFWEQHGHFGRTIRMVQNFSKNFFFSLLPVFMPTDPLVLKFGTSTLECF